MSGSSRDSGAKNAKRALKFGKTYVVGPKSKHQTSIVWLHGLGDEGSSWAELLDTLHLSNLKWICPAAQSPEVTFFGGFPSTAWCDVTDLSEDAKEDLLGLDALATYVASLLSAEPPDTKNPLTLSWVLFLSQSPHTYLNLHGIMQVACCKGSECFSTTAFHPDGRILGTCTSGLVRFWDVAKQV